MRRRRSSAERKRKREQAKQRQREKRERGRDGIVAFPGRASCAVVNAIVARNVSLGLMTKEEAEREARDPKKLSAEVFGILEGWAPHWYAKK